MSACSIDAVRAALPDCPVSVSHEVAPVWREYERASTVITDAYLRNLTVDFAEELAAGFEPLGVREHAALLKSNGGQVAIDRAARRPVDFILSGLAGGLIGAKHFAATVDRTDVLTLDMGGTSADVGVIIQSAVRGRNSYEFEWGIPIAIPVIDLSTVGAGGSSIASFDPGGLLQVGPESAGADPGPAAYGRGAEWATVTDANVVLGRLNPDYFLGGELPLDTERARVAVAQIAEGLGCDVEQAAHSIIEVACDNMANAIRLLCADRGLDYRRFELMAFGGAGPLHASLLARRVGVRGVIVPPNPGLTSAFGAQAAELRVDRRVTRLLRSDRVGQAELSSVITAVTEQAQAELMEEGATDPVVVITVSCRYLGQNFEQDVVAPPATPPPTSQSDWCAASTMPTSGRTAIASTAPSSSSFTSTRRPLRPARCPRRRPCRRVTCPSRARFGRCTSATWAGFRPRSTPVPYSPPVRSSTAPRSSRRSTRPRWCCPARSRRCTRRARCCWPSTGRSGERRNPARRGSLSDSVWLKILHAQLVNVCEEMGLAMMRTSYSPIFSEGLDFSCMILDPSGDLVAMQNINPAMLGQALFAGKWVIDDLGAESFEPGDVVVHNDPYRGGSHMPEHLLIAPFFHHGELRGWVCNVGHVSEIGGMAPGSFASNATEVYQEGLRLPPVKLMRAGEPVKDIWRVLLANHRTPDASWGDFNAMVGSLNVGLRRLEEIFEEHGAEAVMAAVPQLYDYSEAWIRRDISELPNGTYSGEDCQEDDGFSDRPYFVRADLTIAGDQIVVDWSRTDDQARGVINCPYVVCASATYSGIFQVVGGDAPINAGAVRPIDIIARPGSVVNVRHPGACVGGQTELQPRIIELIQGRILSQVVPERTSAASGGTSGNFLFGGVHPSTGEYYTYYHFEGMGWGGRATTDGNDAQNVPHGNCRNTPVEVFESRYPWIHAEYRLNPDAGGPGRTRGGLGVTRILTVEADEVVVNALCDRSRVAPWGVFEGEDGQCLAYLVKRVGSDSFQTFKEAFGTVSNTKFSNVRLNRGDQVMLQSPSGGGYGSPLERDPESVATDLQEGYVTAAHATAAYGVALAEDGTVDHQATSRLREELRAGAVD